MILNYCFRCGRYRPLEFWTATCPECLELWVKRLKARLDERVLGDIDG